MAEGSLRTTFGYANTESDIEFLVDKLEENIQKLRKRIGNMTECYENITNKLQNVETS